MLTDTKNLNFDDIRPYNNQEAKPVFKRLSKNKYLMDMLLPMFKPNAKGIMRIFWLFVLRIYVGNLFKKIHTIEDFQKHIISELLLGWVVKKTTKGLTYDGTENLDNDSSYILISNHRDIVLDVAFIDYILDDAGHNTVEIAFGDNLMKNQFITDLIRINKSFIVKRNLPIREQIKASIQLSAYIKQTLEKGNSIWIAQREGRAKDGNDETNKAIFKMFYLAERENKTDFSEFINRCNITPVSISYEFDPLDRFKSWELHRKETRGEHQKRKDEDVVSMYSGIVGEKGRVHISFGKPLRGTFQNEKEVAEELDKAIRLQYKLWPSNYLAYDLMNKTDKYKNEYSEEYKNEFLKRYRGLKPELFEKALRIYANAVINKEKY